MLADWLTDLMIHRRGAENAEKTYKNLCELGVSAVNPTGKVKFVGQPGVLVQEVDCLTTRLGYLFNNSGAEPCEGFRYRPECFEAAFARFKSSHFLKRHRLGDCETD